MSKYARPDMFKVSTPQQMKIVTKVLRAKSTAARITIVERPQFNAALWIKSTNDTNSVFKG